MRYLVLATDYDGTLAHNGVVQEHTLRALQRLKDSGRKLVLVTGRELVDLQRVFPDYGIFDRVVVENGAVVFNPSTREEKLIGEPPPREFVARLEAASVSPLSIGKVIVATWEPHQNVVLDAIHELGLELQVIFNKGAVMVLPSGINKACGLRAALQELGISPHNAVGIGDAENDHALLAESEVGVAVANALPMLKERADWTTEAARGDGVVELIDRMLESDLRELEPRLKRWDIELGETEAGQTLYLAPYGRRVLLCGTSGSGKTTLASGILERLTEKGYQFCLVDPEGDFENLPGAIVIGDVQKAPEIQDVAHVLNRPDTSVVANLLGVPLEDRGSFFARLLPRIEEFRTQLARPHWIIADEAHHMLPEGSVELPHSVEHMPKSLLLITVHPDRVSKRVLEKIDTLIVVGDKPEAALKSFAEALNVPVPAFTDGRLEAGQALLWSPGQAKEVVRFRAKPPQVERRRHQRKYASGALGPDRSFYFRGPEGALNLRAHNLALFLQMADGVDDDTWNFHLKRHDYSDWLREAVKDEEVAAEVEDVENEPSGSAVLTRGRVREVIERRYTLPE
jgi:HAD superfamily hydrolase (TIGR01484 family)